MADTQHTAEQNLYDGPGLALAVGDPADLPGVNEWTVWIGPAGTNPVAADDVLRELKHRAEAYFADGTLVGYGPSRAAALAMAKCRLIAVLEVLRERFRA